MHAELGEVVAGKKPGRTSAREITIFDSTGMALQEVAGREPLPTIPTFRTAARGSSLAISVYEAARRKGAQCFSLA